MTAFRIEVDRRRASSVYKRLGRHGQFLSLLITKTIRLLDSLALEKKDLNMTVTIDPKHRGTTIRFFLVAETVANLIEFVVFFFAPNYSLKMLLAEGTNIDAAHEALLRIFAIVLACFVTFQTALCAANTPMAIEGRKLVYLGYAAVEAVGISFFWYQSYIGPRASGFDPDSSKYLAKMLLGPFFGRLFMLWRPEYFGKYTVGHQKTRNS